jgi:hypothetical protein
MRFRLRTLLIVLALGPIVLAVAWWLVEPYMIRRPPSERLRQLGLQLQNETPSRWHYVPPKSN